MLIPMFLIFLEINYNFMVVSIEYHLHVVIYTVYKYIDGN